MRPAAIFLLAAALPATARPATIVVTITGTTGEIKVGEGPIFGHSSYQKIPPGDPFVLTYTFDDEKGKQAISGTSGDTITQSEIEKPPCLRREPTRFCRLGARYGSLEHPPAPR